MIVDEEGESPPDRYGIPTWWQICRIVELPGWDANGSPVP